MFRLKNELIKQIEEFFNIKKNNLVKEFGSEAQELKRKQSAKQMLSSGNTLNFLIDIGVKKNEKYLEECLGIYKEIYEGTINKIYFCSSINEVIELFYIKQNEVKTELYTSLNQELNAIIDLDKQKEVALEKFTDSINSINYIYAIRVKTYMIYLLKKSWSNNILIKLFIAITPVLVGVFAGYYLKKC